MVCMGIGLMCSNCKTRIDEKDSAVCPGRKKTAIIGRWFEIWIIFCKGFEDIFEGGRSRCRSANGETETMGLVEVMIRILTNDYSFDGIEGCMS